MKSVLKRLFIVCSFLSILFIIVLLKPEKKLDRNYEGYITQSVAINFTGAYTDINNFNIKKENLRKEEELKKTLVYENLNKSQLINMINKSLNSTISNKGKLIAEYSLKKNVDPVVATAIMLLETGCKWECSTLVKKCNNVGGVKGSPNCSGGYRKYNSLDEGIKKFIDNLSKNYYEKGLDTPEKMNKKYAASSTWAIKVNKYVKEIKAAK